MFPPPSDPSHRPPDDTPIAITAVERVSPLVVGVDGSNAYGRTLSACVPFSRSDTAGMLAALLQSWRGQWEADMMRAAAIASWDTDEAE